MDGITVASTTDTMEDVNQAAGIEEPEKLEAPESKPEEKAEEQPKAKLDSPAKPSKSAAQKRFDALTREIHDLKAKLEAKETPAAPAAAEPEPVPEAPARPTFADFQAQGKTYDDYIEALTDWKLEQREAQRAQIEAQQAEQERVNANIAAWNERKDAVRAKYEDFDEVLSEDVKIYPGVQDALIELENGPEVAYYLGKNRDVAAELLKMSQARAIARVGQISAELGTGDTVSEKPDSEIAEEEAEQAEPAVRPKAKSAAPAPIRPVGGSATKSSVPMDELPYDEYRRIREQQQKARYRR